MPGNDDRDFAIGIRNGLISGKHRKRMRLALWTFIWLVDCVTEEYQLPDGETRGKVWGGAVVTAERIAEEYEVHPDTIRKELNDLELAGYITRTLRSRGWQIEVRNSKKWRRQVSFVPDASVPSVSENGSLGSPDGEWIGGSELRSIGGSSEPPNLRTSEPPTPHKDNAIKTDPAEDNASPTSRRGEEHALADAGEGTAVWASAVDMLARHISESAADSARLCSPIGTFDGCLHMALPVDAAVKRRVLKHTVILRQAVKQAGYRDLVFVNPSNHARDGP